MGEYSSARIRIGGKIPQWIVPELCQAISREGLSLEEAGQLFQPQSGRDLLAARQLVDGQLVLQLSEDDAYYGGFAELEAFLIRQEIPFDRHTEGHHMWAPHCVLYRPECGVQESQTTTDGTFLVQ